MITLKNKTLMGSDSSLSYLLGQGFVYLASSSLSIQS
jgi:hypothetical protein